MESKNEWIDTTWNPVTGCTKISPGCTNCNAESISLHLKEMKRKNFSKGFKLTWHSNLIREPYLWKRPANIMVCSLSDLFHEEVPFEFIDQIFKVISETQHHKYYITTKRVERMKEYFKTRRNISKNIRLGVSVELSEYVYRIDVLRSIPAKVKFVSCEPLLGNLGDLNLKGINWIKVSAEGGPNARPMQEEWVEDIKRQATEQNVNFHLMQWVEWKHINRTLALNSKDLQNE